jgi:hypothetical protein
MNTYIMSKKWHSTQLCPLYEVFLDDLRKVMMGQIFHHTNAPIDFSLMCFPKKLGGLGLINPEWMITALNGRAIARMFNFSECVGRHLNYYYYHFGYFFDLSYHR